MLNKKEQYLDSLLCKLLKDKSNIFFGYLISQLILEVKTGENMIAGIEFSAKKMNFIIYLGDLFFTFNEACQIEVLKHEVLHIANFHRQRVSFSIYEKDPDTWNIAMDVEINQLLDETKLPPEGATIDNIKKAFNIDLPRNRKFEEYYYLLKKDKKKQEEKKGKNGEGSGNGKPSDGSQDGKPQQGNKPSKGQGEGHDEHKFMEQQGKGKNKVSEQKMKQVASDLVKQSSNYTRKCRGTLSAGLEDIISSLDEVDSIIKLRSIFGQTTTNFKDITYFKKDRRTRMIPGYKKLLKEHLLIGIDTSGSIGIRQVRTFLSFVEKLKKQYGNTTKISLVFCDTEIKHQIKEYKSFNKDIQDKKIEWGGGGTTLSPIFNIVKENKAYKTVNKAMVFTDGYCESFEDASYPFEITWVYMPSHVRVEMPKQKKINHIELPDKFFKDSH